MSEKRSIEERLYCISRESINLKGLECVGRVLDIGGGGEGIIGRIFPDRVVAIDPLESELAEASAGPLKIIMDGRDLKFLDDSFETVTSFFTFMYIKVNDHRQIFQEIYRVLKPGGELILWDVTIPEFPGGEKDIFVLPMEIILEDGIIETTYGISWLEQRQDKEYYIGLGKQVGLKLVKEETSEQVFCLRWRK